MAIVGGAIMPLVQGKLVDATSAAFSFIVPAACFAVVGLYALYDLRTEPEIAGGEPVHEAAPAAPRPASPRPAEGPA
jgi:sugar phosphate permease